MKKKDYPGKVHTSLNLKAPSEIASLTKIMTCIVVVEACTRLGISTKEEKYKIGLFESSIRGTSAEIEQGEIYTVHELLLGLMLPSGNDASLALARWAGNVMLLNDQEGDRRKGQLKKQIEPESEPESWALSNKYLRHEEDKIKAKRCYNRFLAEMNKKARLLGLDRTTYANSHGLSNPQNKSCCIDVALLCEYALRNPYFCEIVACKEYEAVIDREVVLTAGGKAKGKAPRSKSLLLKGDPEQMNLEDDIEDEELWNKS